jgi:hypothetical protein
MRETICDICGRPFDPKTGHTVGTKSAETGLFGYLLNGLDVCPECIEVGRTLPLRDEAISAWTIEVKLREGAAR